MFNDKLIFPLRGGGGEDKVNEPTTSTDSIAAKTLLGNDGSF